jgi:hypothetical protein
VGLLLKALCAETMDNTFPATAFANRDDIDLFTFSKDISNIDSLFEEIDSVFDFVSNLTAVDLDFDEIGSLLAKLDLGWLGMSNGTDNGGFLGDLLKTLGLGLLGIFNFLKAGKGSVVLGLIPVLVVATLHFVRNVGSPGSGDGLETSWCFLVANNTNNDHFGCFDNGDGFDGFLLVETGTSTDNITNNMGHASFEADEGSEMWGLGLVVLWPALYATTDVGGTSTWKIGKGTSTRGIELTMAHCKKDRPTRTF